MTVSCLPVSSLFPLLEQGQSIPLASRQFVRPFQRANDRPKQLHLHLTHLQLLQKPSVRQYFTAARGRRGPEGEMPADGSKSESMHQDFSVSLCVVPEPMISLPAPMIIEMEKEMESLVERRLYYIPRRWPPFTLRRVGADAQ